MVPVSLPDVPELPLPFPGVPVLDWRSKDPWRLPPPGSQSQSVGPSLPSRTLGTHAHRTPHTHSDPVHQNHTRHLHTPHKRTHHHTPPTPPAVSVGVHPRRRPSPCPRSVVGVSSPPPPSRREAGESDSTPHQSPPAHPSGQRPPVSPPNPCGVSPNPGEAPARPPVRPGSDVPGWSTCVPTKMLYPVPTSPTRPPKWTPRSPSQNPQSPHQTSP